MKETNNHVVVAHNVWIFVAILICFSPYLFLLLGFKVFIPWQYLLGILLSPILLLYIHEHQIIRLIIIKNNYISVSREVSPFFRLQKYFKISIGNIVTAKFGYIAKSNFTHYGMEHTFYIDYIELITIDGSSKRLFLNGFTKNQYKKIVSLLLENNPNIILENEPWKSKNY